jgi:Ca2+-binding RTX toxin-like protein
VGAAGDDVIDGRGGADTLEGGDSADTITARGGEEINFHLFNADLDDFSAIQEDVLIVAASAASLNFQTGVHLLGGVLTTIGRVGSVFARAGADSLVGAADQPMGLFGLAGNDTLVGGQADDWLEGGVGADYLVFGGGFDYLSFRQDTVGVHVDIRNGVALYGEAAGDSWSDAAEGLVGGSGNDTLRGSDATGNLIIGGTGDDVIAGYGGADTLSGGDGDDLIEDHLQILGFGSWSNSDSDDLYGGDGADTLASGGGNDLIDGGAGEDLLVMRLLGSGPVLTQAGSTFNILYAGQIEARVSGIEALRLTTGAGADTLSGFAGADTFVAGAGEDSVVGGAGDLLIGGEGFDTLRLAGGSLLLDFPTFTLVADGVALTGIEGFEHIIGTDGADTVRAFLADLSVDGGAGADSIADGAGFDTLVGGAGNDTIRLSGQGDIALGDAGQDLLILDVSAPEDALMFVASAIRPWAVQLGRDAGAPVAAEVFGFESVYAGGSAFNDTMNLSLLTGESGTDLLTGGRGADLLMGGAGADWFQILDRADRNDRFRDFTSGQDLLVVSAAGWGGGLTAGMNLAATNRFVAGTVATERFGQFLYDQGAGILRYDSSGIGGAAPVVVATLSAGATLLASDMLVIA